MTALEILSPLPMQVIKMTIQDQSLREAALNPENSFIVQAPAGSGKTELLTQRFLKLLKTVEKPEEIVAITFTRKAAAEMRQRIIRALTKARAPQENNAPHEKMTRTLALEALEKDNHYHWNLIENPNRLRILTIDALCSSICAQTPILSQLGGQPKIAEDASYFYRLATREFLTDDSHSPELNDKIEKLLLHLDNRVYQLESLFTQILAKREQWLSHIMGFNDSPEKLKKHLENALQNISRDAVHKLEEIFSEALITRLLLLLEFASENLGIPLTLALSNVETWQAIANLLLTKEGTFRKSVTKNNGFPPKHPMKAEMEALLEELNENEMLRHALHEIVQSPPTSFNENQWEILEALLLVLPRLTAQLQVIFAENSVLDFVEFSLRASFALGTETNPTDLALYLDHQIRHLLIDEFQDTSMTQFILIEKLLSGWTPGDGRSLFLVGDPMQSIYRFREANVGLFLRAQQQGIAGLSLRYIPLTTNFRSDAKLVNWLNSHFPALFPAYSDITTGAVPYSPATAAKSDSENSGVFFYPTNDENEEAEQVLLLIKKLHHENPTETIAILVRSRSQLDQILPSFRKNNIQYHALEIESLGDRPEIQDALTLTRALLHLADRVSWLALLRTPFCGLKLEDLHSLALAASQKSLWEVLLQHERLKLSKDGSERLKRIVPILRHSISQKGRIPIAQWIEGTWAALSGNAVLTEKSELQNVDVFFNTLAKLDRAHQALPLKQLDDSIRKMAATPMAAGDYPIQVMTIHKAKGLEFDHVILPGFAKMAAHDQNQLLLWLERANPFGGSDLLLAPIKATEDDSDPIYAYLRRVEKNKAQHELRRLLYVALTRAKKSAHCIAHLSKDPNKPDEFVKPSKGSFLDLLSSSFFAEAHLMKKPLQIQPSESSNAPLFLRLKDPFKNIPIEPAISRPPHQEGLRPFKPNYAAIIGTLVHLALEKLALGKTMPEAFWRNQSMILGLPSSQFELAILQIRRALENTLADEKGRWILQHRPTAQSEMSICTRLEDKVLPLVIDRTFCDENGVRWIIDFKTSSPNELPLEAFLAEEAARYRAQLEQYAKAFAKMETRPIRAALYFPLIPHYLEVHYAL